MTNYDYIADSALKGFSQQELDEGVIGFYSDKTRFEYIWDLDEGRIDVLRWHYEDATYHYPAEYWEEEVATLMLNVPSSFYGTVDPILSQLDMEHGRFASCDLYKVV